MRRSLVPELINGRHVLSLFVNHLREPMTWELSFRYHRGWLQRHGFIPHDCDQVWYVVGANGKRYCCLYINPDTCRIGTRDDHFPMGHTQQYRRRNRAPEMSFREQCREMHKELFQESDEFLREYHKMEKRFRFLGT
jgi:hypothetical protein